MAAIGLRPYLSLAPRLRAGQTTPRDFLETCLQAIERAEPTVGAFVHLATDAARRQADASTARWRAGQPLSPIDGMPVALKDVIETIDMPTGQGSPLWEGSMTRRDAASVHALREAGAVIIGKSTTTEFASTATFAKTVNPHDSSRTPGGSSSGSAAAVGAGMVPAGIGTQLIGSILRPASYCGCVGFKPSVGAINRQGTYDHFSQSCHGLLAASLADAWAVARAIADRAGGDPGYPGLLGQADLSRSSGRVRLAVLETCGWSATSDSARAAFSGAVEQLGAADVELRGRREDPAIEAVEQHLQHAMEISRAINNWEGRWPLNTYADLDASKLSSIARERLRTAEAMTQGDYVELLGRRRAAREAFAGLIGSYDAAVTLSATGCAPVGIESTGNPIMNVAASLLGVPTISVPVLQDQGLPLGLQLIGAEGGDAPLFELVASLLRTALDRPDLVGQDAN
jgi:Asp-tRNA(Asn)/Glu-tRNA(Gln) amidotransferase A subunit family amidase